MINIKIYKHIIEQMLKFVKEKIVFIFICNI